MSEIELVNTERSAPPRRESHKVEMPAGTVCFEYRLLETEQENRRLQRLVTELLIKNQQLRERIAVSGDA
jgi:hypothetical protein